MTTLYRPVLIESAEQAEALPRGSVVFDGDPEDGDTYVRVGGDWHTNGHPGLLSEALDLGLTVTALVPIEAEEERQAIAECEIGVPGTERIVHERRLVTPWEESR